MWKNWEKSKENWLQKNSSCDEKMKNNKNGWGNTDNHIYSNHNYKKLSKYKFLNKWLLITHMFVKNYHTE